jgi:hypothetical protein
VPRARARARIRSSIDRSTIHSIPATAPPPAHAQRRSHSTALCWAWLAAATRAAAARVGVGWDGHGRVGADSSLRLPPRAWNGIEAFAGGQPPGRHAMCDHGCVRAGEVRNATPSGGWDARASRHSGCLTGSPHHWAERVTARTCLPRKGLPPARRWAVESRSRAAGLGAMAK